MACARCGGLLVRDDFAASWEAGGPIDTDVVRCLNCGSVEDAVILANRRRSRQPMARALFLDFPLPPA